MHVSRFTHSRCHARWLALLAMLLLGMAPLLSQLAPASTPTWLVELACGDEQDAPEPAAELRHGAPWAKCGYCTLLLGCPVLPAVASPWARDWSQPVDRPSKETAGARRASPIFPGCRSRAPPMIS